jgi:glycosyltransferase involved in cell wall biosynthesis
MYNAERFIGAAVDSVRAQTLEDWELVLFDDGSRDGTLEIARRYAESDQRIRAIRGDNGGTARARNSGLASTSPDSEFVIFLDNDDVWEPDALAVLTHALEDSPDAPAAHGLARAIDPQGQQFPADDLADSMAHRREMRNGRVVDAPAESPTTFESLVLENYPVTPGTMLVRRSVWQVLGGFAAETVPCDDWDMHLRIARRGGIVLVKKVILNWRRHPGAASNNTRRWRDAYLLVRRRSVLCQENTPAQRQAAIDAFRMTCYAARSEVSRSLKAGRPRASARALARWFLYQNAYRRVLRAATT